MLKIDDNTLAIIKHLRDGRKSYREIAEALSLSENTVRSRVNKLKEDGVLDIVGLVDPAAVGGHTAVIVGVKLRTPDLVRVGEQISGLRGVVSVSVVTGRFDLIVNLLLNEEFGLLEFYTQEMTKCSAEVMSTETFIVYKGYNLKLPYVL